jgi:hemerythrin-like domain-containing protein
VREFRNLIEEHVRMEEEQVYPALQELAERRAERQDHDLDEQGRHEDELSRFRRSAGSVSSFEPPGSDAGAP